MLTTSPPRSGRRIFATPTRYPRVAVTSTCPEQPKGDLAAMAQTDANLIWKIADLLRGPYQPNQYGDVILPFTTCAALTVS